MAVGTLASGQTFAGYRIEGLVGRGGMGVVYRARDLALERPVALKLVAPELAADPRFRERFLRESRLAAAIEHPHMLPVHAAGEEDGALYLVMRFVEGEDLKTRLERDGPMESAAAVALVTQIASALDAAHAKGLVHRDVKPGNVLIASSGESYLCDFGLTKPMAAERSLTESGQFLGTLDYVAPEQIKGTDVDGRADQYALGCVLYECLAGAPPFRDSSGMAVMWAHLHDQPPSLHERCGELSPAFEAVLARALAKEPDDRFPGCATFVESARAALASGTTAALGTPRSTGAFVGRERELGELLSGLEDALAGRGRLFLLAGEPGIGKSRLTEELAVCARARGARVLVGRCWEAGGAPAYWPGCRPYAPTCATSTHRSCACTWARVPRIWRRCCRSFASCFPTWRRSPCSSRKRRAFASSMRSPRSSGTPRLRGRSCSSSTTCTLLTRLPFCCSSSSPASSARPGFSHSAPSGTSIRFRGDFWRDADRGCPGAGDPSPLAGRAERGQRCGLRRGDGVGDRLAGARRGIARADRRESALRRRDRAAHLCGRCSGGVGGGVRPAIPEGVRGVIARRLTHLSDECNGSCSSRPCSAASLPSRRSPTWRISRSDELLETLDEAMAARVVSDVPGGPGRLRFAHVLIRDTLYEGLTTTRRVRLHRQAVRALEALYGEEPGPYLAELAHHSIAGSDFDKGLRLRAPRGRSCPRAPRVRGGCAPVRDGP